MRAVHIDNIAWDYQIGKSCIVIWRPVTNEKIVIHIADLLNIPMHSWDNLVENGGKSNGDRKVEVTPSDIKNYIQNKLL